MLQSDLITRTLKDVSKEETSINSQLLIRAGYVDRLMAGVYSFLPLGVRVLTKIEKIIREEMTTLGSQEVLLPALHPKENWVRTGRWDAVDILFKLKGAGDRDLCLGPTHEEVVTPLVGRFIRSYKDLPASVFQIQTKFRNEARAKSGLLRGREFRMKDMYSFHASESDLESYYQRVTSAYLKVFSRCGLGDCTYLTYASGGTFSKYSHEFQTVTPYGEDVIYLCKDCRVAINKEILPDLKGCCPQCNKSELIEEKAIEVGNIFKLMTKFSDAFSVNYQDSQSKAQQVYMGCYGIGPSRLMGSVAEILHDDKGLIWPDEIAPFSLHLISISKSAEELSKIQAVYHQLESKGVSVLYDNRPAASPGEKFADSDLLGIPQRVVISSRTLATESAEVKDRRSGATSIVPLAELLATYSS